MKTNDIFTETVKKLKLLKCSTHGKPAEIVMTSDTIGVRDCCCDKFRDQILEKAREHLVDFTEDYLSGE